MSDEWKFTGGRCGMYGKIARHRELHELKNKEEEDCLQCEDLIAAFQSTS